MAQQKVEMSGIQVNNVYLVRSKKLKGGRTAIRSVRVVPIHRLNRTISGNQHGIKMVVDFDHKYGSGQMVGKVDKVKGVVNFDAKAFIPAGYLKGRGFKLVGYDLRANLTNLHGRRGGCNTD